MKKVVKCGACKKKVDFGEVAIGESLDCPHCGKRLSYPRSLQGTMQVEGDPLPEGFKKKSSDSRLIVNSKKRKEESENIDLENFAAQLKQELVGLVDAKLNIEKPKRPDLPLQEADPDDTNSTARLKGRTQEVSTFLSGESEREVGKRRKYDYDRSWLGRARRLWVAHQLAFIISACILALLALSGVILFSQSETARRVYQTHVANRVTLLKGAISKYPRALLVQPAVKEAEAAEELIEEEEVLNILVDQDLKDAYDVAEEFLDAQTITRAMKFCFLSHVHKKNFYKYWSVEKGYKGLALQNYRELDQNIWLFIFSYLTVEGDTRFLPLIMNSDGVIKLDWKNYRAVEEMSIDEFLEFEGQRPVGLRAIVSPTTRYSERYPRGEWQSYEAMDQFGNQFDFFVLKGSAMMRSLESALIIKGGGGARRPNINSICRFAKQENANDQIVLLDVLETKWFE